LPSGLTVGNSLCAQLECGDSKQLRTFGVSSDITRIWISSGGQVWCQQPR